MNISEASKPFVETAWKTAAEALRDRGEVLNFAVFVNREKRAIVYVPAAQAREDQFSSLLAMIALAQNDEVPHGAPEGVCNAIRSMTADFKAQGELTRPDLVVHAAEAWMVNIDLKNPSFEDVLTLVAGSVGVGTVSQHPRRTEVVIVGWKSKDGEMGHQVRKLLRDKDGKPSLGEFLNGDRMGMFNEKILGNVFYNDKAPDEDVTKH